MKSKVTIKDGQKKLSIIKRGLHYFFEVRTEKDFFSVALYKNEPARVMFENFLFLVDRAPKVKFKVESGGFKFTNKPGIKIFYANWGFSINIPESTNKEILGLFDTRKG